MPTYGLCPGKSNLFPGAACPYSSLVLVLVSSEALTFRPVLLHLVVGDDPAPSACGYLCPSRLLLLYLVLLLLCQGEWLTQRTLDSR